MKPVPNDMAKQEKEERIVHQEQRTEMERSWSQLPSDLLCLISSRVFAGDRVAFRSVCKSWQSVSALAIQHFQLPIEQKQCLDPPCLMFSKNRIFHPIYGEQQHMHIPGKSDAVIRVAKDGWLLMTEGLYGIFFFNPSTKEKVRLPELPRGVWRSMYFSSPPTSTDWVVTVASDTTFGLVILTIKYGEERWSSCEFANNNNWTFKLSYCNPVMHKGFYYFLGKDANLLIHDADRRKFYFHKAPKSISLHLEATHGQQYIMESDGKLLAVFVGLDGRWIHVCRWNFSKKTWETLESLGQKMLFVSRPFSVSQKASVRGTRNKIYFPRFIDGQCLFYSLSTKKFHTFEGDASFENFSGSKYYLHSTWINKLFTSVGS